MHPEKLYEFLLNIRSFLFDSTLSLRSVDFSLQQFMKDSALSAYDQIKGLALDKLKEVLGLPTFLNDPPCSLTAPSYTPNVNGIKKGLSSTL